MYQICKSALEEIPTLKDKVFPLGFETDKVKGVCCVYTVAGPEPFRSLSGKLHHYEETITFDFLCGDYDKLQALCQETDAIWARIAEMENVLALDVRYPEPDAWAADVSRFRKRIVVAISWR